MQNLKMGCLSLTTTLDFTIFWCMIIDGIYLIRHHLYAGPGWVATLGFHHFLMHGIGWNPSDQTSFICSSWLSFIPEYPMDSRKGSRSLMAWFQLYFCGRRFVAWLPTFSCRYIHTTALEYFNKMGNKPILKIKDHKLSFGQKRSFQDLANFLKYNTLESG